MRGAGAGLADDHNGGLDGQVEDLGMVGDEVLDEQPVLQQLHQLAVGADDAHRAESGLGPQRAGEDREVLTERLVPEVGQPGLGDGLVAERIGFEDQLGGERLYRGEGCGDRRREPRLGEVVDPHRRWSRGRHGAERLSRAGLSFRRDSARAAPAAPRGQSGLPRASRRRLGGPDPRRVVTPAVTSRSRTARGSSHGPG